MEQGPERIAVVGMAGRFPGAHDVDAFWRNLRGGVESIARITHEEALASGVDADLLARPDFVRAYGVLDEADLFDPDFFDLTPRDAELMDPQHRLFLEQAWRALEHAGCDPRTFSGPIGVFGGSNLNSYLLALVARHGTRAADVLQARIRADKDFLTTMVSYKLDLRGPSYAVQTACSTSLVAVHLACQSLLDFHCDMALAGGVSVSVPLRGGYVAREGVLAPDGRCRAFDAGAVGTVEASGVGVVALKRLSDALADGDRVHAVILGSAVNNDGAQKVGFAAPSVEGQIEVVALAHAVAGVPAESIGYVEAHGTGTPMGDPVEVTALTRAFDTPERGFCAIGSVKPNIGHPDAAAGVASLIKAVLALEHREIPPSLHFRESNPAIEFAESPFYVADRLLPWNRRGGAPRRAGVSSFGIGGTNAHVVLEEAPAVAARAPSAEPELLVLSARTPEALDELGAALAGHLEGNPGLELGDVAFTLQQGRRAFPHRRALVAASTAEAAALLRSADPAAVVTARAADPDPGVVFLFSGLGTQYAGMGRELYEREPAFREAMDRCFRVLRDGWGMDLREVLYGAPAPAAAGGGGLRALLRGAGGPSDDDPLQGSRWGHPAMFSVGYALAELWRHRGIEPRAVAGHSLGEYVAACVAGVFALEDALALVVRRAELLEPIRGAMAAVALPEEEVRGILAELAAEGGAPALAAVNAPRSCVVAGSAEAVERFAARARARGELVLPMAVRHPFHSPLLEPARAELARVLEGIRRAAPRIPLAANATGRWLRPEEARSVEYWTEHLVSPVRFAECVERLRGLAAGGAGEPVMLELGPGAALGAWAKQQGAERVAASLRHGEQGGSDLALLRRATGQLWSWGVATDWRLQGSGGGRRRLALPGHPMNRRRYWLLDGPAAPAAGAGEAAGRLSATLWRQLPDAEPAGAEAFAGRRVVVFGGAGAAPLAAELRGAGAETVRVEAGSGFLDEGGRCTVRPAEPADFARLAEALRSRGWSGATHTLLLWGLDEGAAEAVVPAARHWTAALAGAGFPGEGSTLLAATRGARAVLGTEELRPRQAAVAALLPEAARAGAGTRARAVDVEARGWEEAVLREAADLLEGGGTAEVACRGRGRWAPFRAPLPALPASGRSAGTRLREGGVYLVAGGLAGAGLPIARYLAETARARLVLAAGPDGDDRAATAARVLEAHGAEVQVVAADPADEASMRAALAEAASRFGALHGVVLAADTPEAAVAGALALEGAAEGAALELVLVCSPAGDAAGTAFLEAFAAARSWGEGRPTVSVTWETPAGAGAESPFAGIAPAEGAELLGRLFARGTGPGVTVRVGDAAAAPALHARPAGTPYVEPRTGLERTVAEMFGGALGMERIGAEDGFFELGGDSLLATQLLSGINERFRVELPLRTLFEASTPARLALEIVQKQAEQVDEDLLARALAEL